MNSILHNFGTDRVAAFTQLRFLEKRGKKLSTMRMKKQKGAMIYFFLEYSYHPARKSWLDRLLNNFQW